MSGWNDQYKDPRLMTDRLIRMLPPEERQRLWRHCKTQEERQACLNLKSEKQLQERIASLLRQRNITFNVSRMDRATTGKVGWPDFSFSLPRKPYGIPCAIECKLPGEEPTKEQVECMMGLIRDGWFVRVVRSEMEFLQAIKEAEAL